MLSDSDESDSEHSDSEEGVDYAAKKITLTNGVEMPILGLGTFRIKDPDDLHLAVDAALKSGYRLFDTAAMFGNEVYLANSIRHVMQKFKLKREDIFVISKLSPAEHGFESAQKGLEKCLKNLEFDYVDLYVMHSPGCTNLPPTCPKNKTLRIETWKAFEKMYKEGKAKAIGVANFAKGHLDDLYNHGNMPPMVNQIEWHPENFETELKDYCESKGTIIQAYMPFGGLSLGDKSLVEHSTVQYISKRSFLTPHQVLLQWSVQQDIPVVFKAVEPTHIISNSKLNVKLKAVHMDFLNYLNKNHRYGWDPTNIR